MEPWINQVIVCCAVIVMFVVVWLICVSSGSEMAGVKEFPRDDAKEKRLKVLYDLGFLCGKHAGTPASYSMPEVYKEEERLHWWNGFHAGVKWREDEKKLNGDFTE